MSLRHYWPRGVGVKANLENVTKYEVFLRLPLACGDVPTIRLTTDNPSYKYFVINVSK